MIPQLLANGLAAGCVYAIVAFGFGLIYNTTKVFHFAHGVVYTTAAYVLYSLYARLSCSLWVAIPIALFAAAALGVLIELLVYRPLADKEAPPAVLLISSLGTYIVLQNLIALLYGNETKVLSPGVGERYTLGGIILTQVQAAQMVTCVLLLVAMLLLLRKTRLGRTIRALSDNLRLAEVLGIEVGKVRAVVFALGSILAGVGACLVALDVGIDPNIGMNILLVSAVAVIVGGVKVFEGAAVGALAIGLAQNLVVWKMSARWQDALTFGILVVFLLFRPHGLLGQKGRL